uniref:ATP-binding cassette domain-containing protein n=1 Tax=uncultured Olegusella sp. TaxID=1979846 RepID=UPI002601E46F
DSQRLGMLKLYRVDSFHQFGAYIWPELQSYLFASAKMTVGMSWKAGVAAELIGSPAGSIGEHIYQAKIVLETADVFAWTIVIVLLAYICEQVFLYFLLHSADVGTAWAIRTAAKKQQAAPISKKLVITSLSCSRGEKQLFEGFTQSFAAGSKTCLMAATGTGKTTLLHIIAGIERADRGELEHEGHVSLAYQKTCLLEQLSALDNIVLATGLPFTETEKLLCEILPIELLSRPVCQLSGGERRCVELVRALAAPSTLVLLDEPFASLDETTHRRSAEFILRHLAGRTLIVATHDVGDATLLGASILLLDIDSDV